MIWTPSGRQNPTWHQSEQMLGGVCYVDLFAGDLKGLQAKIPYFKELGLTYLHLMPCYLSPEGENDGGYAVSDYRQVDPKLGVMQDLEDLAAGLRAEGISLVLDFVFNHTSDEHRWAERALAGVPEYQEYYFMFARPRRGGRIRPPSAGDLPGCAPGQFLVSARGGQVGVDHL